MPFFLTAESIHTKLLCLGNRWSAKEQADTDMANDTNLHIQHGQEIPYSSAQLLYDAWQLSRNRGGADDDKLTGVLSEARLFW